MRCRLHIVDAIQPSSTTSGSKPGSAAGWLGFNRLGYITPLKKVKVAHSRLPSVGFQSWSRFSAVSLGFHYFPPGLQLPPQPLRGLLPYCCLVNRGTMGVNSLPKTVTRQRRDCDLNPGPSAPESSTLATRLPSHPPATHRPVRIKSTVWTHCKLAKMY